MGWILEQRIERKHKRSFHHVDHDDDGEDDVENDDDGDGVKEDERGGNPYWICKQAQTEHS